MSNKTSNEEPTSLADPLQHVLSDLSRQPFPHVPNPSTCQKRASVALILRIRPHYHHWPSTPQSPESENNSSLSAPEYLEKFFAQEWVQHGDPEVVFIKRAARVGDRWTSHVALPGGKRDPEDEDDRAVAVRETVEEIGLDLTSPDALFVGNLPERVVSTSWGKVPIMVLCPFIFLWTKPEMPPLKLQPTEVASTHWVPLRVLLSPAVRTHEYVDVSDRFARQGGVLLRTVIRSILGKMRFSAIRLIPSESLYCSTTQEFFSTDESKVEKASWGDRLYKRNLGDHAGSAEKNRPLLLWGLTLGMLADFLDQLPPHNAVKLWSYPTFTSLDVRLIINILTRSLKRRNEARLNGNGAAGVRNQTVLDSETQAIATAGDGDNPWFIGGLSKGISGRKGREYAVGVMLDGYYDMARRGVWISAIWRALATVGLIVYIVRGFRRRWR